MGMEGPIGDLAGRQMSVNWWERLGREPVGTRICRESAVWADRLLRPGDRVRLWPRRRGDIFDLALYGKTATVQAIEQDQEGAVQVAVIVDDDPVNELGGGRRTSDPIFFALDDVEPLGEETLLNGA